MSLETKKYVTRTPDNQSRDDIALASTSKKTVWRDVNSMGTQKMQRGKSHQVLVAKPTD